MNEIEEMLSMIIGALLKKTGATEIILSNADIDSVQGMAIGVHTRSDGSMVIKLGDDDQIEEYATEMNIPENVITDFRASDRNEIIVPKSVTVGEVVASAFDFTEGRKKNNLN